MKVAVGRLSFKDVYDDDGNDNDDYFSDVCDISYDYYDMILLILIMYTWQRIRDKNDVQNMK